MIESMGLMSSNMFRASLDERCVVIVPVGSLEQHGPHLPLSTDCMVAEALARQAARVTSAEGVPTFVAPTVWTGLSAHHMDFAGTVTLRLSTFQALMQDIVVSLWRHGVRKILILNGHGGNIHALADVVQDLRFEHQVRAVTASYWDYATDVLREWDSRDPGTVGHAGEIETSVMLGLGHPLVREPDRVSAYTPSPADRRHDLAPHPEVIPWRTAEISSDGVLGFPQRADKAKGELLVERIVEGMSQFIREMSSWSG